MGMFDEFEGAPAKPKRAGLFDEFDDGRYAAPIRPQPPQPLTPEEQYRAEGGGFAKSLEKGFTALTTLMAPAAAQQNRQAAAVAALMGVPGASAIANDATLPERSVRAGIERYNALPKNPLQQQIVGAYEANSGIDAPLAAVGELVQNPRLAAEYFAEMAVPAIPGGGAGGAGAKILADQALKRAVIPKAVQKIAPMAAAGAGANAGATFSGGMVPNAAGIYEENGGNLGDALRTGGKQTLTESAVAAPFGAVLPFGGVRLLPTAGKALVVSPADEVAQTVAGNTAIGKQTSGGEMMAAGLLGATSSPVDIGTAIWASRQGEQAAQMPNQDAGAQTEPPAPPPGGPTPQQPEPKTQAKRGGLFDEFEVDATVDPMSPGAPPRAAAESGETAPHAVVETPGPRAVVETPPPRAIVERPAPHGVVETARPVFAEPPAPAAAPDAPLEPPPPSEPEPAPADAAPDAELRTLTEDMIRQLRDAKQISMEGNLRRAIDRIKAGGVNEKPAYFSKLAKEFERAGDGKTAGMLSRVAATLKDKQKAIPKPAQPKPPKTTQTGVTTADEFSENSRKQFLRMVKAMGGVSTEFAADITGEPANQANRILPGFFSTRGNNLDLVARRLHEAGYITDQEYNDVDGGVERTRELLAQALAKEFVGTPEQQQTLAELEAKEADAAAELQNQVERDALAEIIGETPIEAEFAALFDAVPADETQDRADIARAQEHDNDAAETSRIESQAGEAVARGAATGDEGRAGVDGREGVQGPDGFNLERQTEADLAGREAEIARREAEVAQREREAEAKAKADAERDSFTLTGSDRAADANPGQGDIFGQVNETAESFTKADAKEKIDDLGEKIGGARKDTAGKTGARSSKAAAESAEDVPTWRKRFTIAERVMNDRGEYRGTDDPKVYAIFDTRTKKPVRQGWKTMEFASEEAAERAIPMLAVAMKHRVVLASRGDETQAYEIWRDVTDRKRVKVVDQQFATRDDAMRYMAEHAAEIMETKTGFGEEVLAVPEKVMRAGKERRSGPVAGRDFMETFGFRGVEFGNWNNQAERQEVMNHAYDALLDLAEVIGVPPKALSLNGDLGLAFGARGQGLSGAKAHYEPEYGVINLTKMSGAGSLAHEWFHAADHYFGRQDGKAKSERKANKRGDLVYDSPGASDFASHGFKVSNSGVRAEVRAAYEKLIQSMFRKAEQYVEDTQRAEQFVGSARDDLRQALDRIRANLAQQLDPKYYKRNNKPASAEQLAQFDVLSERLIEGHDFETKFILNEGKQGRRTLSGRFSNDTLEAMSAIYKAARGRSGFTAERSGVLDAVRSSMQRYEGRVKMLDDARNADVKTRHVPTSFAMEAKRIDQGRVSNYWTTEHEMAARAFSAYVEDKIAADNGRSDFLAFGADNEMAAYRFFNIRPFPEGDERVAINKAFDEFFGVLQTKETDSGVALFSRDAEPAGSFTPVLQRELDDVIDRVASRWERPKGFEGGRITAVDSSAGLPAAILRAADAQNVPHDEIKGVLHNGHIYLVRENLNGAADAELTIFHEAYGHLGARLFFGPDAAAVHDAFVTLWERIGALDGVRKMADRFGVRGDLEPYIRSIQSAEIPVEAKRRIIVDELLAHVAGRGDFTLKEHVKAYLGALRAAMRRAARAMGLDGIAQRLADFTDSEMLWTLKGMRDAVVSGKTGKGNGTMFARVGDTWPGYPTREAYEKKLEADRAQAERLSEIYRADAKKNPLKAPGRVDMDARPPRAIEGDTFAGYATREEYEAKKAEDEAQARRTAEAYRKAQASGRYASATDQTTRPEGGSVDRSRPNDSTAFARRTPHGPSSPQQPLKLGNAPGFNIDPETRAEEVQRKHQDKMNRWAKVQRQIAEQGGTVGLDQDVYHAMERMTGRAADRIDQFTHETVRPLLKRVADLKTNLDELGTYLMALGAKDRNAYIQTIRQDMPGNGSGMTDAEAAQIIADYRTRPDFAEFDALARDFQALTDRKLKVLVGGGVIDKRQAVDLKKAFGFYVPYKGFETIDESGNRTGGTGAGYSTPKRFSRQAFGRVSRAGQVVENIIRDYEQAVILAEKANVGRYVRNLAVANPDPTLWTVGLPPSQPVMVNGQVGLMQAGFDSENEIRFIENGQQVRIQLHDKLLAQTYNNLGQEPLSFIMKAGDTVNRVLRQTYTQKNPAFIFVNAVRDIQTGLAVMTGEMGAASAIKSLRHAAGAWKAATMETFDRGSVSGEWAKYLDAYRKSGAQTAYYAIEDIEAKQAKLEELLAREGGQTFVKQWRQHGGGLRGAKATAKLAAWRAYNNAVVDVVESLNSGFENMMRLAAFRQYIDEHGGLNNASRETLAEASRIAKNLTVNFNRKGEKTRGMNALYLFWNANVQGTQNVYRAATKSMRNAQVKALLGGMVGLGFMMSLAADDEEDDLTPDYVKDTSIVIHIGGGRRIQVPLAYGLGFFVGLGYEIGNLVQNRTTPIRAGINMLADALTHFSPLGNPIHDGTADVKDVVVAVTPTILKPAVMSATNRNQMGYDIVPKYDEDAPDRTAMRTRTRGGVYDAAAGALESVGADVSPETLKMATTFVTGGLGTFIGDTTSTGMVAAKGGFDAETTPILKRFYGVNDVEEHRARFYDLAEDVKDQAREQGKKQSAFFVGRGDDANSVRDFTMRMKELREEEDAAFRAGKNRALEAAQKKQIKLADAFKKEHDRMVKRGMIERR